MSVRRTRRSSRARAQPIYRDEAPSPSCCSLRRPRRLRRRRTRRSPRGQAPRPYVRAGTSSPQDQRVDRGGARRGPPEAPQLIDDIDGMVTISTFGVPGAPGPSASTQHAAPSAYSVSFNLAYLDGERKIDRNATVLHEFGHVIDFARRSRPSCATSSPPSCRRRGACVTRRHGRLHARPRSASPTRSPSGRCAAPSPRSAPATASRRPPRSRTGARRSPRWRSRSTSPHGRSRPRRARARRDERSARPA